MFDVGFSELLLIFVIGLLILGPERLPRVAAQIGRWVGRARRMANQLRYQLEQEIALEETQRSAKPEAPASESAQISADLQAEDEDSIDAFSEYVPKELGAAIDGTAAPEHAIPGPEASDNGSIGSGAAKAAEPEAATQEADVAPSDAAELTDAGENSAEKIGAA